MNPKQLGYSDGYRISVIHYFQTTYLSDAISLLLLDIKLDIWGLFFLIFSHILETV